MFLALWSNVSGNVAAPTLVTDGKPLLRDADKQVKDQGFEFEGAMASDDEYSLIIKATGTGVLTLSAGRLWVWSNYAQDWIPLGSGADPTKTGYINEGTGALAEDAANDKLRHTEIVRGIRNFTRIALSGTFGGALTRADAWLVRR